MAIATKSNSRAKLYLLLLVVVFIGPIIGAHVLYNFKKLIPKTMSYGHLILPPLNLDQLALKNDRGQKISDQQLKGRWLILYVEPESCDQICLDTLYKMKQVRTRLGKNRDRVQRAILTFDGYRDNALNEYLASLYLGTLHLQSSKTDLDSFLAKLPSHEAAMQTGYIYLSDPLGNIMMSYAPNQSPKDIYSDLTRLLNASRVG